SKRRPDERELPDLFALRRRQDLAEGRTRLRWRPEGDDARRRVRRSRLSQIRYFRQGRRRQEQDQKYRFRRRSEARRGGRLFWRGVAQRRLQAVAAQWHDQKLLADGQIGTRYAADGRFARPRAGPRGDLPRHQRRRRLLPLYRYVLQGGRRSAYAGHGSSDGRAQRERGAD